MELPYSVLIESITNFCVCKFKDINHSPDAPPHYYINVPIDDDNSLLLCIITSKIEKKIQYYPREAHRGFVFVNENRLSFLDRKCIIDCNNPILISQKELKDRIDNRYGFEIISRNIPSSLKKDIINSIKKSPVVREYIKKKLVEIT